MMARGTAMLGMKAGFNVALHVFQHHNGIVHHEPGGDGQRHQGQIIERIVQQIHDPEGADDGKGNGDAGASASASTSTSVASSRNRSISTGRSCEKLTASRMYSRTVSSS